MTPAPPAVISPRPARRGHLPRRNEGSPMQCRIVINMDNAAFEDHPHIELARILRELATMAESGDYARTPRDINGNAVGTFDVR